MLERVNDRSIELQRVNIDYSEAVEHLLDDMIHFRELLGYPTQQMEVDKCWKEAVVLLEPHGIQPELPRQIKRKTFYDDEPRMEDAMPTDPKRYYEKKFYVPFTTHLIQLYEMRFGTNPRVLSRIALLIPLKVVSATEDMMEYEDIYVLYRDDLAPIYNFDDLRLQLQEWRDYWKGKIVRAKYCLSMCFQCAKYCCIFRTQEQTFRPRPPLPSNTSQRTCITPDSVSSSH